MCEQNVTTEASYRQVKDFLQALDFIFIVFKK